MKWFNNIYEAHVDADVNFLPNILSEIRDRRDPQKPIIDKINIKSIIFNGDETIGTGLNNLGYYPKLTYNSESAILLSDNVVGCPYQSYHDFCNEDIDRLIISHSGNIRIMYSYADVI